MDYDIIKKKATYLYNECKPRYPFGYGLSYCRFEYSNLTVDRESYANGDVIKLCVDVKNTGNMAAQEVIQAYVSIKQSKVKRGNRQLKAFAKVEIQAGQTAAVELEINTDELRVWDVRSDSYVLESGDYVIDIAKNCNEPILSKQIRINGGEIADRLMGGIIQAQNCDDYDHISLGECRHEGQNRSVAVMNCRGRLVYNDCRFDGQNTFGALVSLGGSGQKLKLFADEKLLCEIDVTPTGGSQMWADVVGQFAPVNGTKKVTIEFNGNIKEFWFRG
jgi:beta-glucosidase